MITLLVAELFRILIYANWVTYCMTSQYGRKAMEYLCKCYVYRVEIFQSWCAARTTHCDSGYDVSIATCSLQDLYLPKMKNTLFVSPEVDGLVFVLCNVHIRSHPLNEQQEPNNTSWRRKTLILPFEWRVVVVDCVAMEMSQWTYHGTLWLG